MAKQVIQLTEIEDFKDIPKRSEFFDPDDEEEYDRLEHMTY